MPIKPLLTVSKDAYKAAMDKVRWNFDPHLDDAIADHIVNENYRVVFKVIDAPEGPDDALLGVAVEALVAYRTDRGMPRVAEVRGVVLLHQERAALYANHEAGLEHERRVLKGLQEHREERKLGIRLAQEAVERVLRRERERSRE